MKKDKTVITRWFGLLMIFILLASMLSGCSSGKVIKIGFVTEATGVESYIGQASTPALQDYIDKINTDGGIGGYKLQLVTYDTRSEVTDAVTVTKRMIEQDGVVAIVGPSWSAAGIPMADIATTNKVPIVGTTASNVNVTVDEQGKLKPYMFRVCFIDPYQGYAQADYAYNELAKRKVAFLTDISSPYSVGIEKFFTEHFIELGGTVSAKEGYQTGRHRIPRAAGQDQGLRRGCAGGPGLYLP